MIQYIQTMLRKVDRSRSREGYSFISDKRFDAITVPVRKKGAIIIRGGEDAEKHLDSVGANAACLGDVLIFRQNVTISEVLEETRHFEQNLTGLNSNKPHRIRELLNEIDAKEFILQNAKKYSVPQKELDETKEQLKFYRTPLSYYGEAKHV